VSWFDFFQNYVADRRRFGYKPDPVDLRDLSADGLGMRTSSLPGNYSLIHPAITPRSQSSTSSCVGFAWAQGLELAYARRGVMTGDLSPLFVYWLARATHGATGRDDGTYLRAAAKAIRRFGCCRDAAHPFAVSRVNESPRWRAMRDGYDLRGLRGYYRVGGTDFRTIGAAIASGRPVVGGWAVDRTFQRFSGGSIVGPIDPKDSIGKHAMVIVGYDAHSFTLLNSWGTGWGERGYARVSPAFIAQGIDLWVIDSRA
jgi:C1A family cysteine protease